MRIDFLGLQAFVSIAEHGSFQRAAAHLNLSQTALSHRMKKFEEYFGVTLMIRTTRQVTLTPAGLELLPKALRIMDDVQNSLGELRKHGATQRERLAIGCIPTLAGPCLGRLLTSFAVRHPSLAVKIYDNPAAEIAVLVETGAAEFAVTILSVNHSDMEVRPLLKEPFVLVTPAGHPLATRPFADWTDLRGLPLVRISSEGGNRMLIDDSLRQRGEDLVWRYEAQRASTAIGLVAAGDCLGIVPALAVGPAPALHLAVVPLRNPGISRKIGIIFRQGRQLSPAATDLIRHLQREMRKIKFAA